MSNILEILRTNLTPCRILVDMLPMVRERMPEARRITVEEYLAIEAGTLVPTMEMGYSILLDEAPTTVVEVVPTPVNPTTQDEVSSVLDLENHTKVELLDCIMSINADTEITMTNSKAEMITAIAGLDQELVQAFFA